MVRIFIKRQLHDSYSGLKVDELKTLDIDCEELEHEISGWGFSESGCEYRQVVGAEIVSNPK